jgi:DNA-binding NtrC family response regulator
MQLIFVEDDAIIRDVAAEYLHEHGYDVVEAATAEDAMHHLVGAPAPHLVVTDIDLGDGRSGLELADWLHARWPELNVIFASGRLDRMEGRAHHPRETCLAKPFRLGKLIELVRSVAPAAEPDRP